MMSLFSKRPEAPAWIISALATAAITVLAALGHPVPEILEVLAGSSTAGALGLTAPSPSPSPTSTAPAAVLPAPPAS